MRLWRAPILAFVAAGAGWLVCTSVGSAWENDRPPIGADEGRPHVLWQDAESCVGRVAFVYGTIAAVGHTENVHFLNFDAERRDVFKAVVFSRSLDSFPGTLDELYSGKTVRIRGHVSRYRGSPEIQVTAAEQIEVLEQVPALPGSAVESAAPKSAGKGVLRVATYNVENLFDDIDDPYANDDGAEPKPRADLEQVAAVIRTLQADVLALQEVESRGYLERFVEVFLPDQGYRHIVHYEGNDTRGIDVALVSKEPIGKVVSHRHLTFAGPNERPQKFSRDVLAVEIHPIASKPFEVWVLHLKSNSDGRKYAEPVRLAEAIQLRKLLDERLTRDPHARIVVCGDCNDTPDSATISTLVGVGETALQTAWQQIPESHRVSYHREPYRSLIDFVFWSRPFIEHYAPISYRLAATDADQSGSDHFPVIVEFQVE